MGEIDEVSIIASSTGAAAPAKTAVVPPVVAVPETDAIDAGAGYSVLQKGLFLVVILGCVAAYLRMNSKKGKRYQEKSMA